MTSSLRDHLFLGTRFHRFYKSIRSCLRNDHWYQKLVWSYPGVAPCHKDQVRQAKADFPLVLLCPDKSMAPVLAITDMVARARRDDSLL